MEHPTITALPPLSSSSSSSSIDPNSGFDRKKKTFCSLRPRVLLPPQALPLSFPSFAFSLLPYPLPSNPALVDAATGFSLSYPDFISQVHSLSYILKTRYNLSKGDVAFVLSLSRLDIPILYYSLLSIGVAVAPSNPISTCSEISRLVKLVNPSVVFATSVTSSKLTDIGTPIVFLDSPEFASFKIPTGIETIPSVDDVVIHQNDPAVILFSSGTTGHVKAAMISHRSYIAMTAGFHALQTPSEKDPEVTLLIAPMVHSLGFFFAVKGLALGETTVVMGRAEFGGMLKAAERYGATAMTASPPIVVAMARSEEVGRFDLSRLERVFSGGAPMPEEVANRFMKRFPHVELQEGYGSTEAGGISRMINCEECKNVRSVGRLSENVEAKIVDVVDGKDLSVGQRGELWLRGPAVMMGYLGDDDANVTTFDSDGWLKTGDLCYFDGNGFLYVVDRLKELIKYKAYQVPPAELEHLLQCLPDIVDAAVVPYPQEEVGQIPMAFVVKQPNSNLTEQQVIDYIANQVAPYKKIRKVVFTNAIPKSASGKILRRLLATRALSVPLSTS
nr:4-coumarate:CoA ligase 12 [Crinum x powellii]